MPRLSKQTPLDKIFSYNPFDGAQINFFPADREKSDPRVFLLQPLPPFDCAADPHGDGRLKQAIAANGKILVSMNAARSIIVTVNGKKTERYSIVYPKTRTGRKKMFAAY
jgi:hypothetical protein